MTKHMGEGPWWRFMLQAVAFVVLVIGGVYLGIGLLTDANKGRYDRPQINVVPK